MYSLLSEPVSGGISRASFIYTEAIYRCFKRELIYSDEIRWVHRVVCVSILTARAQEVVPCFWLE